MAERIEYKQYNFTSGAFSDGAAANRNLQQYRTAAIEIKNLQLTSTGGLRSVGGLVAISQAISQTFTTTFIHSCKDSDGNDIVLTIGNSGGNIRISVLETPLKAPSTYRSGISAILPSDIIISQALNTLILCHKDFPPLIYNLKTRILAELTYITGVDSDDGITYEVKKPWGDGNPSACVFYGNRCLFAKNDKIYGTSIIQDEEVEFEGNSYFLRFITSDDRLDDEAIETTLTGNNANNIFRLFSYNGLYVFTDSGVFYSNERVLTPSNFIVSQVNTSIAMNIAPAIVQNDIIYLRKNNNDTQASVINLRRSDVVDLTNRFDEENISVLADNLIKTPIAMEFIQGTAQDSGDHLYILNSDGTMAVLSINKQQDILAWSEYNSPLLINNSSQKNGIANSDGDIFILRGEDLFLYKQDTTPPIQVEGWVLETLPPDFTGDDIDIRVERYRIKEAHIQIREALGSFYVNDVLVNTHILGEDEDVSVSRVLRVPLNTPYESPIFLNTGSLPKGIRLRGDSRCSLVIDGITLVIDATGKLRRAR